MIIEKEQAYFLETKHTTYAFRILDTGHLEHLYYGRRIEPDAVLAMAEKHAFAPGNTISYDASHPELALEDAMLEMSSYGKGDIREPFVEIVYVDGSFTSDFLFEAAAADQGKKPFATLPGSYDETDQVDHLCITLAEKNNGLHIELHYFVYEAADVITRSTKLFHDGTAPVELKRLMSTQLDFADAGYVMTTFHGAWAREMERSDTCITAGKFVNASYAGCSSSRANPFVMISRPQTTEEAGDCYGVNLIYSGNHYEAFEVSGYGKTRLVCGINPQSFSFHMEPGDVFEAPEAVMSYSAMGYTGLSIQMQHFVKEHIVRGSWKKKERPVLLNSWEAAYFDINERRMLSLAKAAKDVGVELFVMDDGWFGERNDDRHSLGDWQVNTKKLPGGLSALAQKIRALGLDFGIWVEPEMVNTDSGCYRMHPDWVMEIPGRDHSEGRNQRILDLTNPAVQDYLIGEMTRVFESADISYVKWDMNRIFSDCYSKYLPKERQGEVFHRYMMGLYHVMQTLTERFPDILFEGCAAGGNRFDLGILCYFPQIWASDNTDAVCRAAIQTGYSYGYPMSVLSAHVSGCPNHQTLRNTPLSSRFAVAAFGILGYECNLCDLKKQELEEIRTQIAWYKKWRRVLQTGDFYRGKSGDQTEWTCVSEDRRYAVGMVMQNLTRPNMRYLDYHARGLDDQKTYHFYNLPAKYDIREFGDLINTVSPIHIRQGSFTQSLVAKFVKMDGEQEDYHVSGANLMHAGIRLKQAFAATGYNDQVRYYPDFASRLYMMEEDQD